MRPFKAVKVTDKVYWVGAIDWGMRDFHGYLTSRGTTYNAYLVLADKVTLIDTVKAPFRDELLARISSVIDPARIDYIVSNHAEIDHSGSIPDLVNILKPGRVFASTMGVQALQDHFRTDLPLEAVPDGGKISLGDMTITCVETRMVHWPDSMFSYLKDERLLFSQDGFGMHLASSERFADQIPEWILMLEGKRYFANILLPLSDVIKKALQKFASLNLPVDIVAPAHGPIWRKDPLRMVGLYSEWAEQKPNDKAIVVFDTMWGSTSLMATAISEGIIEGGGRSVLMSLRSNHRSDVAAELLECGALLVGCPTINGTVLPAMADALSYVRSLKPKHLIGAAFGSYGWSGESISRIDETLKAMKVEIVAEPIKCKYAPDAETLKKCHDLGLAVGRRISEVSTAVKA
jgi:flavorubredoxin